MFTRDELIPQLPSLFAASSPSLEIVTFNSLKFRHPDSEETIVATCGTREHFSDSALFWVKSLQAEGWENRASYLLLNAKLALCQPITEPEFFKIITDFSGELKEPLPAFLSPRPGFVQALKMYADWYYASVIAEFADAYVSFCWETTA